MFQVGNRKLADAEIPVRVPRPLDIKLIAPIERELYSLALELVHNRPVINPPDGDPLSAALVIQLLAFFPDRSDINRANSQHLFREQKVRQSFLLLRMNLHQDHIFGIVVCDNRSSKKGMVRLPIQPPPQISHLSPASQSP